ncbi:MAG: hypothetical protein KGL39_39240, partial [Patescibacteria group bacterium]|nr:hypothetical protein [Patescibacteria group bacterium]
MPAGKPQAQAVYPDGTPIPNEKLAEAIQNGTAGYMPGSIVTVTNKAGKRYDVPAERVPEAFKAGWRPEAPSETHVRDVDAYESAHPVETAFRSADEAFNSPDARAAFSAGVLEGDMPGTPLWDAHQAAKRLLPTGISPAELKAWQASRSGYGKAVEELKTTHPTASTLGQAAPLAAQMVGGGPGEAVLRLGEGAVAESSPKLAAFLGGKYATSTLGKAGQSAARLGFQGGFETSAYKAGQEAQQLALSDKDVTSERLLASVGEVAESGVIGTGLGVILGSLGSLSKSGFSGVSKKLNPEDLALKSFGGPTAKQMERMGVLSNQGLATTPEQLAAIENDIALTKAYEQTSSGSSKLTDIEKQIEGKRIAGQTILEVPGAVNPLKSVGERATLVSRATEAAGKEEGDFIKALDQVAKPDVDEWKLAMRQYAQKLIDHGTGEDIAAGRRLIRNYIDRINGLTVDGRKIGQEVNTFEDMFNFRKDRLRWTETSGVSKNYINDLNRVAEGAIEAQIAKVGATAELVPGKGWVISPGGPYAAPRLNNIREILGGGAEVEGLAGGGGVAANANAGAGDAYTAYRGLKDRYARLMAAKLTAERGARLEATAKHGLTDVLSIGTGIAEATAHGLGTGLVSGLGMKAAAAVLSPARRNALLATTMRAIQGGTDTTALKLSGAVKAAVKAKTVAADTVKRLPAATSKIISRYVDS